MSTNPLNPFHYSDLQQYSVDWTPSVFQKISRMCIRLLICKLWFLQAIVGDFCPQTLKWLVSHIIMKSLRNKREYLNNLGGHDVKLRHRSFRLLRRKAAFSVWLPISRNKLTMEIVNCLTPDIFKRLMDLAWISLSPSLLWLPCSLSFYFTWFEAPIDLNWIYLNPNFIILWMGA